jgi:rsbT co-antagonist protein RsbR
MSRSRALQGFSPRETATFIFSLKQPLFNTLNRNSSLSPAQAAELTWAVTLLLDEMGLFTLTVFQKSREEVIVRQQREIAELSTPVVKLWDGILALPLIGTLDSQRTPGRDGEPSAGHRRYGSADSHYRYYGRSHG